MSLAEKARSIADEARKKEQEELRAKHLGLVNQWWMDITTAIEKAANSTTSARCSAGT